MRRPSRARPPPWPGTSARSRIGAAARTGGWRPREDCCAACTSATPGRTCRRRSTRWRCARDRACWLPCRVAGGAARRHRRRRRRPLPFGTATSPATPPSGSPCVTDGGAPLRQAGQAMRNDSALKHATGDARFLDDLPEPAGTLHAALALSPVAHGRLLAPPDRAPALAVPGVRAVLLAEDIPGENDVSPTHRGGEPLLAAGLLEHHGQVLALVVAETRDAALRAAAALRPEIAPLPPVLAVGEALAREAFLVPPEVLAGGQEHFYLEGQIALAVPGEDGEMLVHSSTQHPTEVQHVVARVLGLPQGRVTARCRSMGGAFGGKESNASWVAAAAA